MCVCVRVFVHATERTAHKKLQCPLSSDTAGSGKERVFSPGVTFFTHSSVMEHKRISAVKHISSFVQLRREAHSYTHSHTTSRLKNKGSVCVCLRFDWTLFLQLPQK